MAGLLSNTPLSHVLDHQSGDLLVFQVDLFPAEGPLPKEMTDIWSRQKDIQYSSRTRQVTDQYLRERREHHTIRQLLDKLPADIAASPEAKRLAGMVDQGSVNIVHLIYRTRAWESGARDFEFSRATMLDHWGAGARGSRGGHRRRGPAAGAEYPLLQELDLRSGTNGATQGEASMTEAPGSLAPALKGKTALVTGSTSGIGLAYAKALAGQGANIVINGFGDPAAIETERTGLEALSGAKALYSGHDLTKVDQIEAMMAEAAAAFGGVDILINNAGVQHVAPVEEFPVDKWNLIIALNLTAAFHTTRLAVPYLKQKKWGRIIQTASAHSLVASPFKSAYVTAKHGLAASPRRSRSSWRPSASRPTAFRPAMSGRRWSRARSPTR